MTTEVESDVRVAKHAAKLVRRGVDPSDAKIDAAGAEAAGKLDGVERARRASADLEMMSDPKMPFHVKIGRCAATPDNESDFSAKVRRAAGLPLDDQEMRKAMAAADRALDELRETANRPRLKPATAPARISARTGKMPLRSFPQGTCRRPARGHASPDAPYAGTVPPGAHRRPRVRSLLDVQGYARRRLAGKSRSARRRRDDRPRHPALRPGRLRRRGMVRAFHGRTQPRPRAPRGLINRPTRSQSARSWQGFFRPPPAIPPRPPG
jgi:hypothetical protein